MVSILNEKPENTQLLQKVKCHCTVDLLFNWFRFNQTSKSVVNSAQAKQLNLKTNKTVGQPYSDASPYEVIECSLDNHLKSAAEEF